MQIILQLAYGQPARRSGAVRVLASVSSTQAMQGIQQARPQDQARYAHTYITERLVLSKRQELRSAELRWSTDASKPARPGTEVPGTAA